MVDSLPQSREPPLDHLPQERGEARTGQLAQAPAVALRPQDALLLDRPQQLARVEGVALGAVLQVGDQPVRGLGR